MARGTLKSVGGQNLLLIDHDSYDEHRRGLYIATKDVISNPVPGGEYQFDITGYSTTEPIRYATNVRAVTGKMFSSEGKNKDKDKSKVH